MEHELIDKHLEDLITIESRYMESYKRMNWNLSMFQASERLEVLNHLKELVKK